MQGCFIILNYIDYQITQKAIANLLQLNYVNSCNIIIFDNGSGNGAYEYLKSKYEHVNNIFVGQSKVNLGFSEGNNAAYRYALKICPKYDFVICMNSDVIIKQHNFIDKINTINNDGYYSIVGPSVFNTRLKCQQSPLFLNLPDISTLKSFIKDNESRIEHIKEYSHERMLSDKKAKRGAHLPYALIKIYRNIRGVKDKIGYSERHLNPVISGCCIIYLSPFLEKEDLLFEPDTFLYCEEMLLTLKCETKGYKILYNPELKIDHMESVSTRASFDTYTERIKRECQYLIHAFNVVIETEKNNPWK